jgi:hypothetical protein
MQKTLVVTYLICTLSQFDTHLLGLFYDAVTVSEYTVSIGMNGKLEMIQV